MRARPTFAAAWTAAILALAGCPRPPPTRAIVCPQIPGQILQPGRVYRVEFAQPPGDDGARTEWRDGRFADSILEPMTRPVFLKADDLRGNYDVSYERLFGLLAELGLAGSVGVVAATLEDARPDVLACFRSFDPLRLEIWNHGLDHRVKPRGDSPAEFLGTGVDEQVEHLARAQEIGERRLGRQMRAFGPPGNGADAATVEALQRFPALATIFMGPTVPGRALLAMPPGRDLKIERDVSFEIVPAADFRAHYTAGCFARWPAAGGSCTPEQTGVPIVLQMHPDRLSRQGWQDLKAILQIMAVEDHRAFLTPAALRAWQTDAPAIVLTRLGPAAYELDLSRAREALPVTFAAPPSQLRDAGDRRPPAD